MGGQLISVDLYVNQFSLMYRAVYLWSVDVRTVDALCPVDLKREPHK